MKIDLLELFEFVVSGKWTNIGQTKLKFRKKDDVFYIAFSTSGRDCAIGEFKSWILNVLRIKVPLYPLFNNRQIFAHYGFLIIAYSVLSRVISEIEKSGCGKVVISGFSQGGAVGSILHEIIKDRFITHCITFGQPKCFGILTPEIPRYHRIYVRGDKVTRVPYIGFSHRGKSVALGRFRILPSIKCHYASVYIQLLEGKTITI